MRVGQCWELGGRAYEILGFDGKDVEVMEWESKEGIKIGHDLWVSTKMWKKVLKAVMADQQVWGGETSCQNKKWWKMQVTFWS